MTDVRCIDGKYYRPFTKDEIPWGATIRILNNHFEYQIIGKPIHKASENMIALRFNGDSRNCYSTYSASELLKRNCYIVIWDESKGEVLVPFGVEIPPEPVIPKVGQKWRHKHSREVFRRIYMPPHLLHESYKNGIMFSVDSCLNVRTTHLDGGNEFVIMD